MLLLAVVGVLSYQRLSQSEDPPFTFKVMVVRTFWPGATAREVEQQVTERIEKKLQEVPYADVIRSYSRPGESQVFFIARDSTPPRDMPEVFYQARKKIGDIRATLPGGVQGPFFNDEFGDTFGNIYALTGEGYDYAALKHYADRVRNALLRVRDVAKVELFGEQDERIFVEISSTRLATLGVDLPTILNALSAQNAVAAAGSFETGTDRIYLRPGGGFDSPEKVREMSIRAGSRLIRLGDIAEIRRGYADPPQPRMRYMGRDALGIGVSMAKNGDIIALGQALDAEMARIQETL
ncbi:MAG TPA: efflux RND transporter permease subunit, partial [Rhodocyclaceae bacterium]|nr:efflux RND transporter permease subunit [Rhodocyclaceae bacterium]